MPTSEKQYIETIQELIECLQDAHDNHIYDDNDEHPEDCHYCQAIKDARKAINEPQ